MYEHPILIVEDEPDGQELVSRMLQVMNVSVEVAEDGESAWAMLQEGSYTAAIIDLALPGMDGVELLRAIRGDDRLVGLPCVAITAYHTPELKQQSLTEGFDAYYAKPLDRAIFVNALESVISGE